MAHRGTIWLLLAWGALTGVVTPAAARADAVPMTLAADSRLQDSGLLGFLVPRFALKTGVKVSLHLIAPGAAGDALGGLGVDAVIALQDTASDLQAQGLVERVEPVFASGEGAQGEGGATFSSALMADADHPDEARRFLDWLSSDIGQRTVGSFAGQVAYRPAAQAAAPVEAALPEGDLDQGHKLSHLHCGRCHVVSEKNRFGGIGSTPSFAALRAIPGWEEKFLNFWTLNPHPSFTQVEDLTEPFDPNRPPHIAPVEITQDDLAAIVAYAASIEPKDLGAGIQSR